MSTLWYLLYHTTDTSEQQAGQKEASQLKKHDQSDSDEALYLPPLPPDQLDTVVKVMASAHMHAVHLNRCIRVHVSMQTFKA